MEIILVIVIIVVASVFGYIRNLLLSYKQKKVIKIFKLYPNALKSCMLQKKEFTYYNKAFHSRIHNYNYIINTTEDIIKNQFNFERCNVILETTMKEYESWEHNYNYVIKIFERYYEGLLNYIVNYKVYPSYSIAPERISKGYIISLSPILLEKLATVKEHEYEALQNTENKFYIVQNPKEEATEIKNYIKENNIRYLYHFTDIRNIKSIIAHGGLFSWYSAPQRGIEIINPGGDSLSRSLDKKSNLEDYVRLSFTQWHPMMYKKEQEGANIVVLKIHPSVAILHNTLFSNMNATSNMCSVGADLKALKRINLEATRKAYVKSTDKDFAELQAEVLIKTHLPLKYILNINEFIN